MNSLGVDLTGKAVLLKAEILQEEYRSLKQRLVRVAGGFGAVPYTSGSALIVEFLFDGERARFDGRQVERVVEEDEVEQILKADSEEDEEE